MTRARDYARATYAPELIRKVAALLQSEWDPRREFSAPDGERAPEAHARTILAILATGADTARVRGYLRRCEEDALGAARTTSFARGQLAMTIWRLLLDRAVQAGTA